MNKTLHIGENIVLSLSGVIGIFKKGAVKGRMLEELHKNSTVRNALQNSAAEVIVIKDKKTVMYHSKISPGRLIKRAAGGEEK